MSQQRQQQQSTSRTQSGDVNTNRLHDIEWYMLDKTKYFPYTVISSVCVRTLLYPLTLVRTRLQVQIQNTVYKGTWDAIRTIYQLEGFRALYRSFYVYNLQIVPNVIYITTFEKCREHVTNYTPNTYIRAMIAGGSASLVSQTMVVPIDVVTQHMMLIGQKASANAQKLAQPVPQLDRIQVSQEARRSNVLMLKEICNKIYKNDKLKGFYRGYLLSTILMSTNSAFWWMFYYIYQDNLKVFYPAHLPPIILQCICAPLSTLTSNVITNPLDVIRARIQITKNRQSALNVVQVLWQQERLNLFFKGLTARLMHSSLYSFFIILGYETVKKNSLKEEYQKTRMTYKAPLIIPARFLASISHIIVAAIILMSRESNIYSCGASLAESSDYFRLKDTEFTIALSLMIGLCGIELITFIIGLSIYSNLQSFLCTAFHLAASISMLYFLFNRSCSDQIWPIFATCSCLPFLTEFLTIIRICACKRLPAWL